MATPAPALGSIVTYRSRTGDYDVPAIVTATQATLFVENVQAGYIPTLSSVRHVHLTVFSAGKPGKRGEASDFRVVSEHPISENVAGCYQEWDIPEAPPGEWPPGSWRWGPPL